MLERAENGINLISNDHLLLETGLANNLQIGPGTSLANIPASGTYRRGLWSLTSFDRSLAGWGIGNTEIVPINGNMPNFLGAWGVLGQWNGGPINEAAEFGLGFELQRTGTLTLSYYGAKPSGVVIGGKMTVSVYGPGVEPHQDFNGHIPVAQQMFADTEQRWQAHELQFSVSQTGRYVVVFRNSRDNVSLPNTCIVMPTLAWRDASPSEEVYGHLDSPQQLVADINSSFPRMQFTVTYANGSPLPQGYPVRLAVPIAGLAYFRVDRPGGTRPAESYAMQMGPNGHVSLPDGMLVTRDRTGMQGLSLQYVVGGSWVTVHNGTWPMAVKRPSPPDRYQVTLQSPPEAQLSAPVDGAFPAMSFVAKQNDVVLPRGANVSFSTVNQGADVLFSDGSHQYTETVADDQGHANLPQGRLQAGRQAGGAQLKASIAGNEAGTWHLTVQAVDRYQVTLQSPPEAQLTAPVEGDFPAMTFVAKRNDVVLPRGETVTFATVSQDADVLFSDGSHQYPETVAGDQGQIALPSGRLHAGRQMGGAQLKAIVDSHEAGSWQLTVQAAAFDQRTIRINPESISMPDLYLFPGEQISVSVLGDATHRPLPAVPLTARIQKNGQTVAGNDSSVPRFSNNGTLTSLQLITTGSNGIGHPLNIQAGNQSGEYRILFESDGAAPRTLPLIVTAVHHLDPVTRNESVVAATYAHDWWFFLALDSEGRPAGQQRVDFTIDDPEAHFDDGSSFGFALSDADTGRVWVPALHVNGGPRSFNINVDSFTRGLRAAARLVIEVRPRQTARGLACVDAPRGWPACSMGDVVVAGGAGRVRAMADDGFPMLSGLVSFTLDDTDQTGTHFVEQSPIGSIGYDGYVPVPAIRLGSQRLGTFKIGVSMVGASVTAEQRYQLE
ncbi:hypothetical protein [Paludibacterium purpuratum]|uniref:Uncharacterized protein n=1 Tax=Paludibacterium purpuratum TaxID=1144873 RepID=A0A4R7AZR5_9NEIS|nr:hypothetical protein [Paludibacterium purpuratum]TDR73912.1 hypothetical protein DFP86_112116 [Paludibacterium purpuratum]